MSIALGVIAFKLVSLQLQIVLNNEGINIVEVKMRSLVDKLELNRTLSKQEFITLLTFIFAGKKNKQGKNHQNFLHLNSLLGF